MAPPDPALGPRWFPGARLNFAENLLRYRGRSRGAGRSGTSRDGSGRSATRELGDARSPRVAAALRAHGIEPGDRVAGFLPNLPETVIAMLAAASLGAIWSSCSPDFGANGVLDRFGQIEPAVLFCADGYRYAGKAIDSLARVREVCERIPAIERVVVVPYLARAAGPVGHSGARCGGTSCRRTAAAGPAAATIAVRRPPAVRSPALHHVLLRHHRAAQVHGPRRRRARCCSTSRSWCCTPTSRRDDRIFYFTTCGWMMWNWLVSSLAVGATVVLFDGAPLAPPTDPVGHGGARSGSPCSAPAPSIWRWRRRRGSSRRGRTISSALRAILSTGSPLARAQLRLRLPRRQARTSTSRASAAAPTSSPASRSAIRSARSGAASCRRAGWAWRSRCSTTAGRPVRERDG